MGRWVEVDDDYQLVRYPRRQRWGTAEPVYLASAALVVGGLRGATGAGLGRLVGVVAVVAGVALAVRGRRWFRPDVVAGPLPAEARGSVDWDDEGLTVWHPLFAEAVTVPWSSLRVGAVAPAPVPRQDDRHRLFAVQRRPGTLHPLAEARWFLTGDAHERGKVDVPLLRVDLSGWLPNVALLFQEPRRVPLDPAAAGPRPRAGALSAPTPGLYLRVVDPTELAAALDGHGVRRDLTCDDWTHATGIPHP